eukprot:TRINITY_DN4304_c1_g3_i1.p1 TRINITY_DN4304_c1_g3~~TRINITY_DN4304_c1_g3_i1.p1  ORF type:complete len:129 (+),score=8.56 TRINITY_DN4304_c1_g3_i1:49-387(+)
MPSTPTRAVEKVVMSPETVVCPMSGCVDTTCCVPDCGCFSCLSPRLLKTTDPPYPGGMEKVKTKRRRSPSRDLKRRREEAEEESPWEYWKLRAERLALAAIVYSNIAVYFLL